MNAPNSPHPPSENAPPSPSRRPRRQTLTNEENLALIDLNYAGPTRRDTPRASIETTHSYNTQTSTHRLLPPPTTTTDTSTSSSSSTSQPASSSESYQGRMLRPRPTSGVTTPTTTITIDPIPRLHPSPVRSPSRSPQSRTRASRRRNSGTARRRGSGGGNGDNNNNKKKKKKSSEKREWSASEYSIEGMSEKEIERCRKKGINPRLKAEMDNALRGRRFSPLVGNTYIG